MSQLGPKNSACAAAVVLALVCGCGGVGNKAVASRTEPGPEPITSSSAPLNHSQEVTPALVPLASASSVLARVEWSDSDALELLFREPDRVCIVPYPYTTANCSEGGNLPVEPTRVEVRRLRPGEYSISRFVSGELQRSVPLKLGPWPDFPDYSSHPNRVVAVGDQIGWAEPTAMSEHTEPVAWRFATLGPNGLSASRRVAVLSGFGVAPCRAGSEWVVDFSGPSDRIAFYSAGAWSSPVQVHLDVMGAGPSGYALSCRPGLALFTAAMPLGGAWKVEDFRCSRERCATRRTAFSARGDEYTVVSTSLAHDSGVDRTLVAWTNREGELLFRLAPWDDLASSPTQTTPIPLNAEVLASHVRREVALIVYRSQGIHVLRFDANGPSLVQSKAIPAQPESSSPAPKVEFPPDKESCPDYLAEARKRWPLPERLKHCDGGNLAPECEGAARIVLERRVVTGKPTIDELRMLKAICKHERDAGCASCVSWMIKDAIEKE